LAKNKDDHFFLFINVTMLIPNEMEVSINANISIRSFTVIIIPPPFTLHPKSM